jgi:broad specificity phosphatase PhoE
MSVVGKLYVVRHGQAREPGDLRLPGSDLVLTATGRMQARALADRLAALPPVVVHSSDLQRAQQTGAIIATRCGVPLIVHSDLRELDFGTWGDRTYAEIVANGQGAARFFEDVRLQIPPAGESADAAAARVHDALAEIVSETGAGSAVVVGHAGSLRLALAQSLGLPLSAYWRLRLDYASLSILDWTEHGIIVDCLNDVSHLQMRGSP